MTIRPNSVGKTHRFTLRSLIAASLSVILLGETAFAYKPETSLWADRKSKSPVMLASAALTPSALPKLLSDVAAAPLAPAKILSTDLPAAFVAQVQIKKALPGPRKNTVVVLEDVHQNVDAQRRLSSALLALAAEPGSAPVPVALEGAVGGFKVGAYHRFPDRGIAKAVADSFLASGDLAGPSHAGFIAFPSAGARGLALTGADDAAHYAANVAAYHAASKEKAAAQAAVADRRKDAAARAATVFSNDLRAFDAAVDAHHRGALPLGDFVRILIKNGASDSVLVRFDEAYRMERGLDLAAVERERRAVLEKLLPRLDEGETRDLVRLTLGYREGAVSFAGYYAALENVCRKNGVELSRTPAFAGYLRYVAAADGIDAAALFAAVSKAETAAYARLAAGEAARIVSEIRALRLAERITDFALTTSDWTAYQASRSALRGLDLTPFERFYEEADARDAAMVRAASRDANISVLVIGGFHSEAVAAALQKTGRPVIVCSPKLARVDAGTGSAYLSVFDREKTPLERLFAGEKLFLAAPPAGAVRPLIPAPDPSLEMAHDVVALTAHARGDEAAARRAAGELGVDAVLYSVVHGDGSTEMVETIGGENIRTVISANGTVERGAQSTRKIGGLTVATYTGSNPGALLSGLRTTVTNVVNRTVANRLFLMLPGFVLMAGSMYILFYLQPVALATAPRMISVFVAMSIGVVWVVAFGHQALGILAARNRPVTAYPMIEELRSLDILPSDRVGAVASVIEGNIHLNGYFFDVTRNRSRLTEEQQRSLLREERRHIRYQRSRGLTNVADRNFVARGFEEFWVNVVMPVLDGLGWTADLLGNLRREQNVDPALLSERADLRAYLQKLYAERESPGSQEFEQVIFVSDQHGTIDVFDDLILDAILQARPIREIRVIDASETWTVAKLDQTFADLAGVAVSGIAVPQGSVRDMLEQLGQSTAERLRGHVFFHNLRSLTDAGRFSPDVAARAQEYLDAGFEYRFNPDAGLDAQLQYFGVSLNELRGKIFFHNLGDLMDRGPYGIKIFRRSKELIDAQLSDFIVGNHDLWTMLNLMGVHLPFYRGYKLYDYTDHIDAEDPSQNVQRLLAHYHNTMPESLDKTWWAERMAEYREYHDKRQKEVWIPQVDAPVVAAWKKISAGTEAAKEGEANGFPTALSKAQLSIWDRLRGFNTNTDTAIWAGSRAVGTVSVGYWKRLLADMKAEVPAGTADPTEVQKLILEMTPIVERIIPELEADITQKVKVEGKWWWRMFEALNSQNYTSAEWWGMDWVFHEGWGPTVLKELNEILAREQGEGAVKVTNRNYFRNGEIDRVVSFFKKNFTLFNRDIQQNVYMHAFLPVDMDKSSPGFGEFYFTYKGVTYRGKGRDGFPSVWEGLRLIENDVRTGENVSELMEALELVNSWYADNTTLAKPGQVSDVIKDVGAERLSKANGFNRLFTGHIPFVEFAKQREKKGVPNSFMTDLRLFFEDHGMGSKFGSRGAYVITSPNKGVILRGRENEKSKAILSNVRTVMNEKEVKRKGDPLTTLFDNPGISAAEYLDILIGDVEGRLQEIDRTLSGGNLAASSLLNRALFMFGFGSVMFAAGYLGGLNDFGSIGVFTLGLAGFVRFAYQALDISVALVSRALGRPFGVVHPAVQEHQSLFSWEKQVGAASNGKVYLNQSVILRMTLSGQASVIAEELRHVRYQRIRGLNGQPRSRIGLAWEEIVVNLWYPIAEVFSPDPKVARLSSRTNQILSGQYGFQPSALFIAAATIALIVGIPLASMRVRQVVDQRVVASERQSARDAAAATLRSSNEDFRRRFDRLSRIREFQTLMTEAETAAVGLAAASGTKIANQAVDANDMMNGRAPMVRMDDTMMLSWQESLDRAMNGLRTNALLKEFGSTIVPSKLDQSDFAGLRRAADASARELEPGIATDIDAFLSQGTNAARRTAGNRYLFAVTFMGIMVASILWGNPAHSLFDAGLMMFGFLGAFNFLVQGTVMLIARLSAYMDWEPTELHWAVPRYGDLRSPYNTAGLVVGGRILLNRGLMEHLPLSQQRSVIREEIRHQRYQRAMGLTYGERGFFSVLIEEIAVNILMPAWEIIRPNAEIDELSREESPEHAVVRELTVSTAQLEELSAGFRQEIRAGMGNNPSSVEMLHTVARFPNGRETGLIATIDWGGSTARVSIWELEGNGVVRKVATMKDDYLFSDDEKKNPRGLYSMLTNKLEEVIRLLPGKDQDRPIDVVVSFAFPPTRWSKSWSDPNGLKPMSPKEIRESFNEEFARRGRNRLTAQRGENDTLGPIMRETYARRSVNPKAQPATVSVILGTGHNVAAFIDDSIWNFESAGFDGVKAIATSMDEETDRNQTNPGEHIFEKMVTGDYLGEILRTSLARLRRETKEFAWTSPSFTTPNMLESEFVSEIAATRGEKEAMSRLLAGKGVASPSDNEIATTYALAASILNRSAGLVAMEIAATIRIQDPGLFNKHIVVIEGGVYYKADRYPERLRKALEDILTKPYADKIEIVSNKGREGAGMAVLVAAATRGDRTPNALIVDQQNEDEIRVAASPSALDDPYRSVQTVIKGVDLQGFLASRLPAVKVQTKTASGGKEGAHQQWTFEDGSGEYSGDITVRLADGIWTITGQTSIQQLTEDIYEHILSVLSRERLSQEADGRLRSFGNRLGLAATFLAPAILSGLSLLVTGGDATGAGWITTFAITGLWALGSLPFLYQAFWIVFAPRPGAFWHGIHTIPGVQIAWGDLGRGVVAQAVGDQVLINSNLFGYLPPSQQRSALREEYRHMLYRARANRSGIRVSSPLSRAWEEWYVNVVMPVTDAIDALRGVHHIQVLFVDKPAVRIPVRRDDGGIRFRNRFGKGGPVDPSLNADGIAALGMILIGSGIPAGVAVTVGAISGWIARSNGLSRRASIAVGASIGAALLAPGLALAAAVAAAAIIAYRRMAPSLLARRWISEGRRYADAVRNTGQTSLLDALDAAAPRGVFFGRRTANDFRNAALSGFAQAANAETNETRRALQWATFAGYRRSVDAGNVVTSAVQAGERAFAGARISVAAYHFNQVGEAAVPSEIAEFRALIAQARRDREDGREVSLVAAVAGEIPAAYRAEFDALVNANRDIVGVVTVSDDLRTEDGLAYSYEKLLQKAMEGSDLDAVRALMSGSYENAAFVSFSKIPSQFLADGRLRAIWTVLANIGAGWAPVPVDTMIRAAELVKQQA